MCRGPSAAGSRPPRRPDRGPGRARRRRCRPRSEGRRPELVAHDRRALVLDQARDPFEPLSLALDEPVEPAGLVPRPPHLRGAHRPAEGLDRDVGVARVAQHDDPADRQGARIEVARVDHLLRVVLGARGFVGDTGRERGP